jgi:oligopeptide/dipeptide ABC transporter ATP-binding protein
VFYRSAHPYTLGLRAAMPSSETAKTEGLRPIEGTPPDLFNPPIGCPYFARCPHAMRICELNHPPRFDVGPEHYSRCWLQRDDAPSIAPELYRGEPA